MSWYHTLELPGGIVTPGIYDHRALVPHYGLPDSLDGKRALDVGTADGFWAFELERRGADVIALDVDRLRELDLPGVPEDQAERPLPATVAYTVASDLLGSHVRRVRRSAYEIDPTSLGRFDLVHSGDLLLHLERPLAALRRIRSVMAPGSLAIISDVVDPELVSQDKHSTLVRYHGGWDGLHWWTPSVDALAQMIIDAGFESVRPHRLYMLRARGHALGLWRAVMHALP